MSYVCMDILFTVYKMGANTIGILTKCHQNNNKCSDIFYEIFMEFSLTIISMSQKKKKTFIERFMRFCFS